MDDTPFESLLRPCGVAESALFDYLDAADGYVRTATPEADAFARHLDACADCGREVAAYRTLFAALQALPVPLVAPAFDRAILSAALPESDTDPVEGFWRRAAAMVTPGALWTGGLSGVAGATLLGIAVAQNGGLRATTAGVLAGSIRWGIDLMGTAVGQLVAAIHVSDLLLGLSRILKPVCNAALVASGATGPEFWLMSTLLSVLALAGAVRLAAGNGMAARAAEREVRHVALFF